VNKKYMNLQGLGLQMGKEGGKEDVFVFDACSRDRVMRRSKEVKSNGEDVQAVAGKNFGGVPLIFHVTRLLHRRPGEPGLLFLLRVFAAENEAMEEALALGGRGLLNQYKSSSRSFGSLVLKAACGHKCKGRKAGHTALLKDPPTDFADLVSGPRSIPHVALERLVDEEERKLGIAAAPREEEEEEQEEEDLRRRRR